MTTIWIKVKTIAQSIMIYIYIYICILNNLVLDEKKNLEKYYYNVATSSPNQKAIKHATN